MIGRMVEQINMPKGSFLGAIVREVEGQNTVLMAHHDLIIHNNDHLIVFVSNRQIISHIEKMFTVSARFF